MGNLVDDVLERCSWTCFSSGDSEHRSGGKWTLLLRTTLIPLPPPPIAAFSITGKPADSANAMASAAVAVAFSLPGMTGTPHCFARSLAEVLSPKDWTQRKAYQYKLNSKHLSMLGADDTSWITTATLKAGLEKCEDFPKVFHQWGNNIRVCWQWSSKFLNISAVL